VVGEGRYRYVGETFVEGMIYGETGVLTITDEAFVWSRTILLLITFGPGRHHGRQNYCHLQLVVFSAEDLRLHSCGDFSASKLTPSLNPTSFRRRPKHAEMGWSSAIDTQDWGDVKFGAKAIYWQLDSLSRW